MTVFFFSIFVLSLLFSFVFTRYVRDVATAHGWVAVPSQDRHLHGAPLPRLGGVAIFLSFVLSVGAATGVGVFYPQLHFIVFPRTLLTILVPAFVVFLLGVYDDIRNAGPYLKFVVQAIAAAMLFFGGFGISDLPVLFGARGFPWFIGLPLTVLWVLAITNAFNLIDGLDGLAAGSALFSTVVVFVAALLSGSSLVALMTIALAGATLGFLRYNFNPATIFLGDCGSLFIGFLLSALALEGAQKSPTIVAVAIPVVSFGLPILETSLSVVRRWISGRPVFTADREHIHHKLLQRGLTHRQVVIVLYAVSALFALLSLFLLWPTGSSLGLVLAVVGTGVWVGIQRLGYLEFGELRRVAQRTLEQRQIFVNNLAIRRATEELKVARDYDQLCRILVAAFSTNDFDAFDLRVASLPSELAVSAPFEQVFHWSKSGGSRPPDGVAVWTLRLELVTTSNRRRGLMSIHRSYTHRGLHLDINLLTSVFPVALADALDRTVGRGVEIMPPPRQDAGFIAAQAG